jgi:hypothetical protein
LRYPNQIRKRRLAGSATHPPTDKGQGITS